MSLSFNIDDIPPQEIEDAKKFKGWLKKKSSNVIAGWKARFFMIAESGEMTYSIAYFDDEKDAKPRGHLDISRIQDIHYEGERIFSVVYADRQFQLKPKSAQLRSQWSRNIMIVKKWIEKYNSSAGPSNYAKLRNSGGTTKGQSWKVFSGKELASICFSKDYDNTPKSNSLENNDTLDSSTITTSKVRKRSILPEETAELETQEILEKCGLSDYLDMNKKKIESRVLCGFLEKRSRGKMKYFMKRWFILVSAKSLESEQFDEDILQQSDLPDWMELDVLYQFTIENKEVVKKPKSGLKMSQCIEIFEKDMSSSKEKGFTFSINMGDRLNHLMATTEAEKRTWIKKLKTSITTAKELFKGQVRIKKNIDVIISEYDSKTSLIERRKRLREKIDIDILRFRQIASGRSVEAGFKKIEVLDDLLHFLSLLSAEMHDIMVACLAKQPKREDLIKEYTDYLHEFICSQQSQFWDDHHSSFTGVDLLKMASWIIKYQEDLRDFIDDDRIEHGLITLLRIHTTKSTEVAEGIIDGILEFEKRSDLTTEAKSAIKQGETLTNNVPIDLFKIINEGLDFSYKMCPCPELCRQFSIYGDTLIKYYLEGITNLIEEYDLSVNQLVSICNNAILLTDFTNKYYANLISQKGVTENVIDALFNRNALAKQFMNISNMAFGKVEAYLLEGISDSFEKKNFIELKLEDILAEFVQQKISIMRLLHDRYKRKGWKTILDATVLQYFQCMILSCPKSKKDQVQEYIEHIEADNELLNEQFGSLIFDQTLKQSLKPFKEMVDFISEDSEIKIQKHCRNLRACFGRAFTFRTVKNILELRKDLEKETRNDMIQFCQETLMLYNKEHATELEDQSKDMKINVLGVEQGDLSARSSSEYSDQQLDSVKRKTISMELSNTQADDSLTTLDRSLSEQLEPQRKLTVSANFKDEGTLLKKRSDHKFYEKRYFRIRNGFLFWYLTERSQEAQNKVDLSVVEEIREKENKLSFTLILEGKQGGKVKHYKLKAEGVEEREIWVSALKREINKAQNIHLQEEMKFQVQKTGQGKAPIFKDFDAIRRMERAKQKLAEKKRKQEEKQKKKKGVTNDNNMTTREISQTVLSQFDEIGTSPRNSQKLGQGRRVVNSGNATCWTKFMGVFKTSSKK